MPWFSPLVDVALLNILLNISRKLLLGVFAAKDFYSAYITIIAYYRVVIVIAE